MTKTSSPVRSRVLIVEDHPMFRQQIAHLIAGEPGMEVCGETDNIQSALEMVRRERPDLIVADITLKGSSGLELIKMLKAEGFEVPVLVLSMHEESLYAERVIAAGAKGYLTKYETSETVLKAVAQVLAGQIYLSEKMTAQVLRKLSGEKQDGSAVSRLTDRELEVFQLIGGGRTTRDIAETLHLGVTTVDTYRTRIKEKLGLRHATELQHRAALWVRERA